MSPKLAVLIGVSHVDGLTPLLGVGSGVKIFEEWAVSQGFETVRFDDLSKERTVSIREIRGTIEDAINAGDVEKLFVYFAGHGIIRGYGEEYWLLSEAAKQEDEAVNVSKSAHMSFYQGFGHIAFFGDACSTAATQNFSHVTGLPLFPRENFDAAGVQVDEFYAAQFGHPAYEVRGKGLFSSCLIPALQGREPEAVRDVEGGMEPRAVVSQSLRPVLESKVRLAANKVGKDQRPFCRPGSEWRPNVLSWVAPRQPPAGQEPSPRGTASPATPGDVKPNSADRDSKAEFTRRDAGDLAKLTQEYLAAYSEATPFTPSQTLPIVTGASVTNALWSHAPLFRVHVWTDSSPEHPWQAAESGFERPKQAAGTAMVRFGTDRWAGLALLPGYSCTATIRPKARRRSVDSVAYLPLDRQHASTREMGIDVLVAETSAQVRLGRFDVEDFDENERLRVAVFEDLNPTLTVLMSYILSRAGRRRQLQHLIRQSDRLGLTVPFDLPLLANVPLSQVETMIAPGFPMMTSGWALLEDLPAGPMILNQARRHLSPSMWTTFRRPPFFVVQGLAGSGATQPAS